MHRITLLSVLVAGCAGTVGYGASVSSQGPDLVYAAPGVQVIADFDEPIFYSDNFYWRYDGSTWYRSHSHIGGWVYATPPPAVLRIDRPHRYVHYRPQGWVARRDRVQPAPIVRDHRRDQPTVRDHRDDRRPAPQPARGHDRRDDKRDNKKHDDHKDDDHR